MHPIKLVFFVSNTYVTTEIRTYASEILHLSNFTSSDIHLHQNALRLIGYMVYDTNKQKIYYVFDKSVFLAMHDYIVNCNLVLAVTHSRIDLQFIIRKGLCAIINQL